MYIYILYIYIYIYIYICNHENNVHFRLSPHWLCGKSCTWALLVLEPTECSTSTRLGA